MKETKRSISLRIDDTDFKKIKAIAYRLRTRESEVFRFALKMALAKMSPLYDENIRGAGIMPVFVECGSDIATHFRLDSARMEHVINNGLKDENIRVDMEDISLLAMSSMSEQYIGIKLKELVNFPVEQLGVVESLRRYLNDKYIEKKRGPTTKK